MDPKLQYNMQLNFGKLFYKYAKIEDFWGGDKLFKVPVI